MKRGAVWIVLNCLMVTSLVLASCGTSTSTNTSTSTSTPSPISSSVQTPTPKVSSTTAQTTVTTAASNGNWWDSLGVPQYGGTMTLRCITNIANFDPVYIGGIMTIESAYMERLFADDWTLNPSVFSYSITFRPSDYVKGDLAQSWEFADPSTFVIHLRQGIHWQDIPPANGREFIADDVVFHYDRAAGLGDGYTKPGTYFQGGNWNYLKSVTATDKYTVVLKWSVSSPEVIYETLQSVNTSTDCIENSDAVKLWGDLSDWHHAIGTGPFILNDFVSGSAATLVKNPNYWGYDERYPQNKLPYIDSLKILIITDYATALAALRTGKLDVDDLVALQDVQLMKKTNPEIKQALVPAKGACTIDPRNDKVPFTDIRVREAMQMAIDLSTIAKTYYGSTCSPNPSSITSMYMAGWGWPYDQWPADLQAQYAYNPIGAKQLLAAAGYPNGFKTNIIADAVADMDLLQIVKSYFTAVGIDMSISVMDDPSFVQYVGTLYKHDQLSYNLTGSLGLIFEPMRHLTRFQTGYGSNYMRISNPVFDTFQAKAMADTNLADIKEVVKEANELVAQQHFDISLLQPMTYCLYQPWLKGYNGQTVSITGTGAGPTLLYFYTARFWIDSKLKTSLGR